MREFFDNIPLDNEEISKERLDNIKTSVLSRVKEEKAMSKKSTIRMVTIAVAAATTAALSAMIASAEQPTAAPAADVDYTVKETVETTNETGELPGEAAFKEYIEKAKAEDVGAPGKTPENANGWTKVDPNDYVCIQPADNPDVYYYYFQLSEDDLKEKLDSGFVLIADNANAIHPNEVFVND